RPLSSTKISPPGSPSATSTSPGARFRVGCEKVRVSRLAIDIPRVGGSLAQGAGVCLAASGGGGVVAHGGEDQRHRDGAGVGMAERALAQRAGLAGGRYHGFRGFEPGFGAGRGGG